MSEQPTPADLTAILCREYHPMHWDVAYRNRNKPCAACTIHAEHLVAAGFGPVRAVEAELEAVTAQRDEARAQRDRWVDRRDTMAARSREQRARAEQAEAREKGLRESVEALAERAAQRTYMEMAVDMALTVQTVPGDVSRAIVPSHWRAQVEAAATVPVEDLRTVLLATSPDREDGARAQCASSHDGHPCGVCDREDGAS